MDAIREERSNIEEATATAAAKARAEALVEGEANMLLETARLRFGVLPASLVGAIGRLSPEQHIEALRFALECTNAEAFESALNTMRTRG
jgi:hypothetical protein